MMGAQQLSLAVDAQTNTWKVCDFATASADDIQCASVAIVSHFDFKSKFVKYGDT